MDIYTMIKRAWNAIKLGGSLGLLMGITPGMSVLQGGLIASLIALAYFFAGI